MKGEKILIAINILSVIVLLVICWPFILEGNLAAIFFFFLVTIGLGVNSYLLYRRLKWSKGQGLD